MSTQLLDDIISTSVGGAVGGAVAGLALYGVQLAHQWFKDWRDSRRVLNWMKGDGGRYPYRSTRAIASFNNLTEDRVRFVCSRCPAIVMSRGDKEDLWTLHKETEEFRDELNQRL